MFVAGHRHVFDKCRCYWARPLFNCKGNFFSFLFSFVTSNFSVVTQGEWKVSITCMSTILSASMRIREIILQRVLLRWILVVLGRSCLVILRKSKSVKWSIQRGSCLLIFRKLKSVKWSIHRGPCLLIFRKLKSVKWSIHRGSCLLIFWKLKSVKWTIHSGSCLLIFRKLKRDRKSVV